ncbi:hypothetical protein MSG28_008205, partial [Choristoneura fumiferana]
MWTIYPDFEFVPSKTGTRLIQCEGYRYHKRKYSGSMKTMWRCVHHHKGCKAVLYTVEDTICTALAVCFFVRDSVHYKEYGNLIYGPLSVSALTKVVLNAFLTVLGLIPFHFEKSTKGTRVLVVDGFRFNTLQGTNNGLMAKIRWRCSRNREGCRYVGSKKLKVPVHRWLQVPPPQERDLRSDTHKQITVAMLQIQGWVQSDSIHCVRRNCSASFVTSQRGNTLISLGGFTFYHKKRESTIGPQNVKKRWIRLNGYLYSYHIRREMAGFVKTRWYCTTHHSRGCRASLYTIEDQIVSCKTEHNHESVAMPSRDLNTYSQPYFFSTTSKGSRFLIIDGYKYHLHKSGTGTVTPTSKLRWRCSKFRTGCKAIAHTVLDEIIT